MNVCVYIPLLIINYYIYICTYANKTNKQNKQNKQKSVQKIVKIRCTIPVRFEFELTILRESPDIEIEPLKGVQLVCVCVCVCVCVYIYMRCHMRFVCVYTFPHMCVCPSGHVISYILLILSLFLSLSLTHSLSLSLSHSLSHTHTLSLSLSLYLSLYIYAYTGIVPANGHIDITFTYSAARRISSFLTVRVNVSQVTDV